MKVAVLGRGNVGGGLADLWERAGHEVTRIGRESGDVSDVEAVVVAVPVYAGPLENATAQENFLKLVFGISQGVWAHSCIGLRRLINSESSFPRTRPSHGE